MLVQIHGGHGGHGSLLRKQLPSSEGLPPNDSYSGQQLRPPATCQMPFPTVLAFPSTPSEMALLWLLLAPLCRSEMHRDSTAE